MLSDSALGRASYPFERTTQGEVAPYGDWRATLELSPLAEARLEDRLRGLERALGRRPPPCSEGSLPPWATILEALAGTEAPTGGRARTVLEGLAGHCRTTAYAEPFVPALGAFLTDITNKRASALLSDQAIESAARWYLDRLIEFARFVLHVEFKAAGTGYREWCSSFSEPRSWLHIAEQYPVLIRFLGNVTKNCHDAILEMLDRLVADEGTLSNGFDLHPGSIVEEMDLGLSDPHRLGRSVTRLYLEDGTRLIYKPKSLAIDAALYEAFGDAIGEVGLAPINILARQDYGWVEDVHAAAGGDKAPLDNNAIGRATAFFWLLNTTDLHVENVVPGSAGVYALDLETLLLPPSRSGKTNTLKSWRGHSVFTTQLFDFSFGEERKQNISAFNPSPDLEFNAPQVLFELVDDDIAVTATRPRPRSSIDEVCKLSDHEIETGFRAAVSEPVRERIAKYVEELDSNCLTRVVVRDTSFYGRILDRMRQPRFLRDGALLYLDLFALHVGTSLAPTGHRPDDHELVEDEIRQLLQGDIPYFSTDPNDRTLDLSRAELPDFFRKSGSRFALEKLRELERSDVSEQLALIRIALGEYRSSEGLSDIASDAFVPRTEPARWLSMFGDVAGMESRVDIGEEGFFAGTWGILMALEAASFDADGDTNFLDEQSDRWRQRLQQLRDSQTGLDPQLLGYSGLGGELFAKSLLYRLNPARWSFLQEDLDFMLSDPAQTLDQRVRTDQYLDVIGGVAGLVLGCEQVLRAGTSSRTQRRARAMQRACARRLMAAASTALDALAWTIPSERRPLLGYAHGWAGVVVALSTVRRNSRHHGIYSQIGECLGDAARFPLNALRHDDRWLDYRGESPKPLNRSWCNGKPGLLRGLLAVREFWSDGVENEVRSLGDDLRDQLNKSETYRFCCGEMGTVDLFLDWKPSPDGSDRKLARAAADSITCELTRSAPNLVPEHVFPSLFHGRAGVLYTAARLDRSELPSLSGQYLVDREGPTQ